MSEHVIATESLAKRTVGVRFDPDTIDEIRAVASRHRIKISEAVRMLVEWGLESQEDPS
ncbi:hypothetical protein [Phenylobacterium sp.]|uniref:hypothetical protein n=1 Tax=Phenylobacterium sp. TaxID=1871053 RepID=UPI0035B04ECE